MRTHLHAVVAALVLQGAVLLYSDSCSARRNGEGPEFRTFIDAGFGFVDEDGFVLVLLGQGLAWKGLEMNLAGPLRLRVVDRSPGDGGVVREQDWDQYYEWARIVRNLSFLREWDDAAVELYFGELNGVGVGHGAVADMYYNSTDMDHYQGGLLLKGALAGNGMELMLENALAPEILVGRAFISPISWFVDGKWPRRLEIGFTVGADLFAPRRLSGNGHTSIPVLGGDVSFRVFDEERFTIMPYADLMGMDGELGVHAGLANTWIISEQKGLALNLRGEYRYVGSDYHPAIFNPFYEYNRRYYEVDSSDELPTFADYLADSDPAARSGMMFDASFEWNRGLRLGARYDSEGAERAHWVMFRIDLFPWDGYNVAAFYAGQDVNGGADLISADSLISVAMRGRIYGPVDLFAEFTRRWRRVGDDMGFANETGGGVGLSFTY